LLCAVRRKTICFPSVPLSFWNKLKNYINKLKKARPKIGFLEKCRGKILKRSFVKMGRIGRGQKMILSVVLKNRIQYKIPKNKIIEWDEAC
jgi:hypothetical protein